MGLLGEMSRCSLWMFSIIIGDLLVDGDGFRLLNFLMIFAIESILAFVCVIGGITSNLGNGRIDGMNVSNSTGRTTLGLEKTLNGGVLHC